MPLPEPDSPREELHLRDIRMRGYRRADGGFDIEGSLIDRKQQPFQVTVGPLVPALAPIHEVAARLTIDLDYQVLAVSGTSDTVPYAACHQAGPGLQVLVGLSVADNWARAVRARLGDGQGCSHMIELVIALGTVAFQTLVPLRRHKPEARVPGGKPFLLNHCMAFREDGPVAALRWPELVKRPDRAD